MTRVLFSSRLGVTVRRRGLFSTVAAFEWAKQNQTKAAAYLKAPEVAGVSGQARDRPIESLEDYLEYRGWQVDHPHGVELVSHVLSAPLTLAYSISKLELSENVAAAAITSICCVGPRAETTLPTEHWKETLLYDEAYSSNDRYLTMDFCGPDVVPLKHTLPSLQVGTSSLTLSHHHRGYFHDMPDTLHRNWDMYMLFNPGVGHPHLQKGWNQTVGVLLQSGKLLCLTAHSQVDADRDTRVLKDEHGVSIDYQSNPFASRIVYQDPFERKHLVSPNTHVAWIFPS